MESIEDQKELSRLLFEKIIFEFNAIGKMELVCQAGVIGNALLNTIQAHLFALSEEDRIIFLSHLYPILDPFLPNHKLKDLETGTKH